MGLGDTPTIQTHVTEWIISYYASVCSISRPSKQESKQASKQSIHQSAILIPSKRGKFLWTVFHVPVSWHRTPQQKHTAVKLQVVMYPNLRTSHLQPTKKEKQVLPSSHQHDVAYHISNDLRVSFNSKTHWRCWSLKAWNHSKLPDTKPNPIQQWYPPGN